MLNSPLGMCNMRPTYLLRPGKGVEGEHEGGRLQEEVRQHANQLAQVIRQDPHACTPYAVKW
jgi:hypothetical protein